MFIRFLMLAVAFLFNLQAARADGDALVKTGDALQVALPVAALASTYYMDDSDGRWMLVKGFASSWATVYAIKYAAARQRPGENSHRFDSFPSGHTFGAFSGAAFLQTRYGYKVGLPAYALATLTGISRVHGNYHYADDVIAGAGIAMLWNWFYTTPYSQDLTLVPTRTADQYGLLLSGSF